MPITWGMSITSELPEQYLGDVVPVSYNAGFICLSYFISLVGAMSTLELVSRRTSHKGIYNQYAPEPPPARFLSNEDRNVTDFEHQYSAGWSGYIHGRDINMVYGCPHPVYLLVYLPPGDVIKCTSWVSG